ncbi:hypothetical protein LSH36_541g00000, partial [Paralvinella palmiformis]
TWPKTTKDTLIIGEENVSRITATPHQNVQLESFPGARFQHFTDMLKDKSFVVGADNTCILRNGWLIRPVPRRRSNIPVFKDLILETSTINPSSPLVGFANDDILFAYNIITTIAVILESLVTIREQFVFITGRRRNVDGELIGRIDDVDCPQIVYLLGKDRSAFSQDSADYFLFSSNTVRKYWAEMPEFVIGRAGYDNWIISSAVARNATAIEATETITALHQTGEDGIRSGVFLPGHKNRTDLNLNRDLIPDFDYSAGYQYCNGWMTNSVCSERRYQFKSLPKRCITLTKRTRIK